MLHLCYFTFQYVSINTERAAEDLAREITLHSNMFLLIQSTSAWTSDVEYPLHSNMFLLIPITVDGRLKRNVSLHSNMFLLIPAAGE